MRVLRSGMLVLAANLTEVLSALVRNLILARLLTVEQFGIAATFAILMTLVETFQNAGLNRMIVQDPEAMQPHFMASLHGTQLVIGVAAGVLMAILAWPFAWAMDTPTLVVAYLTMAVIPLCTGFTHLETFRAQREGRFAPQALRSFISQPIGVLAVWPGFWWFGDYRAALVAIFAQQLSAIVLTHVAVRERFALAYDRDIWRRAFAFAWPLTLNGFLMFWVVNGDRMVVSNRFGAATLAWLSVALMLTMMPANLVARTVQTLALPALARNQHDGRQFAKLYNMTTTSLALVGVSMTLGLVLLGKYVLLILFGERYLPAQALLGLVACMNGVRLIRAAPVIAAMARGETRNPLYANIIRACAIPLAFAAAWQTGDLTLMLGVGIGGEVVAAIASGVLAWRHVRVPGRQYLICTALALCAMVGALAIPSLGWWAGMPTATGMAGLVIIGAVQWRGMKGRR
ncbi:oligosaccharide flippase family protein [Sphingomonas turrisvirgatae]|uniref:Polysaccharide biosynthesis protein n=1 Tax=Sphingomonas turrisvirgatae TaxID=1888892 RepID=A0A1E3LTF2_9SPHN|nr:oligosaccharide flippase family protein [Sphingomonas turrisvirgatae]ODP36465.1 hypothetical protein BFL28_05610 [Sphingomonas turrisvirgatae]